MSLFLQQLVAGLTTGSVYAGFAAAFVLMYRTTGILNFALGGLSTVAVYMALSLHQSEIPIQLGLGLAIVLAFVLNALFYWIVAPVRRKGGELSAIMLTLGVSLILESGLGWMFSYEVKPFPAIFGEGVASPFGITISWNSIGLITTFLTLGVGFYLFLRNSRWGVFIRAAVSKPSIAKMYGIPVAGVFMMGWGLAGSVGALSGILVANEVFVSPSMLNSIIIYSFCGAILGGLDSPIGGVVGGLIIGLLEALIGTYIPEVGNSLKMSAAFSVVALVLLVRPQGLFGKKALFHIDGWISQIPTFKTLRFPDFFMVNRKFDWGVNVFLIAAIMGLPWVIDSYNLFEMTGIFAMSIGLMGLSLLVGYSGQLSLGHGAFIGLGSYGVAMMVAQYEWSHPTAWFLTMAAAIVLSALLGWSLTRLDGPKLAAATISLGVIVPQLAQRFDDFTGGSMGILVDKPIITERWEWLDEDRTFFLDLCSSFVNHLEICE